MAHTDKTAIVIITYNRQQKLKNLISSIEKYTKNYNLYILDNGSSPAIKLNGYNLYRVESGLYPGAARNFLFDKLENEKYVVTLDDDMLVTKGWLDGLLKTIKDKNCAGVGARIVQQSSNRIHSQGGYFEIDGEFITFYEHFRRRLFVNERGVILNCDWLASGCSIFKREIIDKFRYDENLPNMEDPMHSYDIKQAGYELYSTSDAVIIHTAGPTSNPAIRSKQNLIKSICYIHEKYGLNPVLSWGMDRKLGVKKVNVQHWLRMNKIKLGIIKSEPQSSQTVSNDFSQINTQLRKTEEFSIIVPYRNRPAHLKIFLKQLRIQQVPYELIIVNLDSKTIYDLPDVSPKNVTEILIDYTGPFAKAFALNVGAKKASNNKLIFIDVDVLMHPRFLMKLIDLKLDFAIFPVIQLNLNDTTKILQRGYLPYNHFLNIKETYEISNSCSQILIPLNTFIEIGGYDERFIGYGFEDLDMAERIRRISKINTKELISNELILIHLHHNKDINQAFYNVNRMLFNKNLSLNSIYRNRNTVWGLETKPPVLIDEEN